MSYKSDTQPFCRYCGKPIAKSTTHIYFGQSRPSHSDYSKHVADRPATREDAQRHSNFPIVSVRYSDHPTRHIYTASTWDGESYVDQFFCNGDHAKRFAYVMARAGEMTVSFVDAMKAAGRNPKEPIT